MKRSNRQRIHDYWRKPWDQGNLPERYLEGEERSRFLVQFASRFANPQVRILEIGCNVGRNLHFLYMSGFRNLHGIEISEEAVRLLRERYRGTAARATIQLAPIEEIILSLPDRSYDLTFTMAVLEHLHPESEWVFPQIVRVTNSVLITIEDERTVSERHFPRNYRKVFESRGMMQVEEISGKRIPGLGSRNFVARAFRRMQAG